MPRMGRIVIPNYPHHIVRRGHNRQVVFAVAEDYQRYLTDLRELKDAFGVKVYAYCLMTNHVHLLLAPGGIGRWIGAVDEGSGGACDALPQSTGGAFRYFMGKPLQIQCGAVGFLLACLLPLHRIESSASSYGG